MGVAHKRSATSGDKRSATVLHRLYHEEISKSPLTRLASKLETQGPEDQDQRTKGPDDQGTRGPRDQRTKGPENQRTRTKGVGGNFDTN